MTTKKTEYTLCAEFRDKDGGEWLETLVDDFTSISDAVASAKVWARTYARENGARLVDVYALDNKGNASD